MRWCTAPSCTYLVGVAVTLIAVAASGCSGDTQPPASVATVGTDHISQLEVERLATDPGFLAFIGVAGEPPDTNLESTAAGQRTLTWLIQRGVVEAELSRHDVEVDPDLVRTVEDELARGQVASIPDDAIDHVDPIAEGPQHELARSIADYRTLDAFLRKLDPDDPATRTDVIETFDSALERVCGPAIAIDDAQEQVVRARIETGTPLEVIAVQVPTRARTGSGFPGCIVTGEIPQGLAEVVDETELGVIGVQRYVRRSDGSHAVFFFRPTSRDIAAGEAAQNAGRNVVARLRSEGVPAFYDIALPELEPNIDPDWGIWDPVRGVSATSEEPNYETIVPPATTSTTGAVVATPEPERTPAANSPARFGAEARELAGPAVGDPGTADLARRATAALNLALRDDWQAAVPVRVSIIKGATSLSYPDGRLQVGSAHAGGDWTRLQAIMAHEFGHHIAFEYGTQANLGAAPAGWPSSGRNPVERWADCIARDFTGYPLGSHRDAPCDGPSFTWTVDWTAPPPSTRQRTG